MTDFQRICLVHYHEIGLKGKNRSTFEMRLLRNIESLLQDFPVVTIQRISGRLCVFLREGTDFALHTEVAQFIANIPGVARVSFGFKCPRDMDAMIEAGIGAMAESGQFGSFKVQARRSHTDFPVCSMDMNRIIGGALSDAYPQVKVQMVNPDLTVGIEVVEGSSYIFAHSIRGIGGLPVGSSGRVMCLMSSGIDSPVAAWRIARRGAVCFGIHFSGRPQTADTSEYLVDDIAHVLEKTGCIARIYVVPFGDYQHEIAFKVPPKLRIVMYRRLMFMIAERLAKKVHAGAIVTGESLGQVASQTLENINATNSAVTLPVLRPLIGTDKLDIINDAQKLGTFEISSQDAPDCCTLFMPRSPETHAKMEDVLAAEALLPLDEWIPEIMEKIERHDYRCPGSR